MFQTSSWSTKNIALTLYSRFFDLALREVLVPLPADMPGIVIVQHMPKAFTGSFAESLNKECQLNVCEAREGEKVERGKVLISPGDQHMILKLVGKQYAVSRTVENL